MGWPYQQKPPMGWPLDYDSGLVPDAGFWAMLEGSGNKVFDLSGNGNIGTFVADTHWVPGKFGSCLSFDGNGDCIDVPYSSLFDFSLTDKFSISFWLYPKTLGVENGVIGKFYGSNYWYIQLETNNRMKMRFKNGTDAPIFVGNTELSSEWTHLTVTWDTKDVCWFINGQPDGCTASTLTGSITNNEVLNIGNIGNHTGGYWFDGLIDEVLIFRRALSASKIALLYREPFCMFKDPAEVALLGGYQAVPPAGIPIFRRRRAG